MNLLTDAVFSARFPDGSESRLSLPGVLAQLSSDDILSFSALQIHQEQAWYCFLVQLAAVALARTEINGLSGEAVEWERALRCLVPHLRDDEAWCLVVGDLRKPAFMQPIVPEGNLSRFRDLGQNADCLDVLITAKNHDVKEQRITSPQPQHWCYSIICVQTLSGFSGRGNYGISRMNGGFSSRPWVGLCEDEKVAKRFRRDVDVALRTRTLLCEQFGYAADGATLLWTLPWANGESLTISDLDPSFIEVCRRLRLAETSNSVRAYFRPTNVPRTAAKELNGNLGDIWTPVHRKKNAALTLSASGYTYSLVQDLLFGGDYKRAPCQIVHRDDTNRVLFKAAGMSRGQGVTGGFHTRTVPIPGKVRLMLTRAEDRDRLRELSQERIEMVSEVQRRALRPAVLSLVQGAPRRLNSKDTSDGKWRDAFQKRIDEIFFPGLWRDCEREACDARRAWARDVARCAEEVFREALCSIPIVSSRRYAILAAAESRFRAGLRKTLPDVIRDENQHREEPER